MTTTAYDLLMIKQSPVKGCWAPTKNPDGAP